MYDFQNIIKLFDLQEPHGIPEEEILQAVNKWDHLPSVLTDFYRCLGEEGKVCYICDQLLEPHELYEKDDCLHFYDGMQGAVTFLIKMSDIQKDDPPVFLKKGGSSALFPVCDSLFKFLNGISSMQAINEGLPFNSEGFYDADEKMLAEIEKSFTKKDFSLTNLPNIDFYSLNDDDILAVLSDNEGSQVGFASSNIKHFEEIDSLITSYL